MKKMNLKKYYNLNLQLFAEGEEGTDGDGAGGDDQDDEEESDEDGEEEKKYSEKEMEAAIEKRLARERRKWNKQQKAKEKTDSGDKAGKDGEESEDSKARKAAEAKSSSLEMKVACYEAGVAKDSVDDVAALARAYMEADEDLELEDAIEKVVKKYPSFKKGTADPYEEDDKSSGNWGQRQNGKGNKKLTGVEAKFYEMNPDLK